MFSELINPGSIAVLGASSNPKKIGYVILQNLVSYGYEGEVYPINPKGGEILGFRVYEDVNRIPSVDLSVITLPADTTLKVFEDVAKKSKFIIPIAGGFGELGPEGKEKEKKLMEIANRCGARVLGPNTVGLLVPKTGVNTALIVPERSRFPSEGSMSFISQSGALGLLTMDSFAMYGVGVRAFINLGNRIDINENELLKYFGEDGETKSIVMYIESFKNGREFIKVAGEVSGKKGVVVLKAGRTKKGEKAASLHTGALGSNDAIADGAFRQYGIIRAYSELEMLDYGRALAYGRPLQGERIAVVTSAGGVGVVSTDYIESSIHGVGLKMAEISPESKRKIKEEIVPFGSVENPIDMTAQASDDDYDGVLRELDRDENVDAILVYALFQTPLISEKLVDIIERWHKEGSKPIVVGVLGSEYALNMLRRFENAGIPAFPSIERSVKALRVLYDRGKYLDRLRRKR